MLKLNLGCGRNHKEGYVNVDKFGNPDVLHDLEVAPWPWPTSSVSDVEMVHVFEHLGETLEKYKVVIQELYRVCANGAVIHIVVPHPTHKHFYEDPTHVRAITPANFEILSKRVNRESFERNASNSTLGLDWDVNFEVRNLVYNLEAPWSTQYQNNEISLAEAMAAIDKFNNVAREIIFDVVVVK